RALLRDGRLRHQAEHLGPVLGHGSDDDIGAADVDPDYVAHEPPRLTSISARRSPRSPPTRARRRYPACSGGDPTGTPAVRAPSKGDTTAPRARRPRRAVRAGRSRTPARWSRSWRRSAWRRPAPGGAARWRWSRVRRLAG